MVELLTTRSVEKSKSAETLFVRYSAVIELRCQDTLKKQIRKSFMGRHIRIEIEFEEMNLDITRKTYTVIDTLDAVDHI